jgi:sugar phosphate permease
MVAVLALPLGVTFFRDQPERYGALPDGRRDTGAAEGAAEGDSAVVAERQVTLAEARRTRAFWIIVAGDAAVAAFSTGLVFHHYDLMAQSGLSRVEAATVFVPLGLITAFALLTGGALMDRVRPRFMLAGMLVLQAAALMMAGTVPLWLAPFYGAAIGLTQGMKGAISGSIYAAYFGRRYLGAIRGTASTIGVAGTAVGPLVFAMSLDGAGSYWPALVGTALVSGLLAAASLTLRPPAPIEPGHAARGGA